MSTINQWRTFQSMLGKLPIRTGTVTAHNVDGTSTLSMTGGGTMRAIGQSVPVSSNAFVRGNEIIGEAPSLTAYTLDV